MARKRGAKDKEKRKARLRKQLITSVATLGGLGVLGHYAGRSYGTKLVRDVEKDRVNRATAFKKAYGSEWTQDIFDDYQRQHRAAAERIMSPTNNALATFLPIAGAFGGGVLGTTIITKGKQFQKEQKYQERLQKARINRKLDRGERIRDSD